DEIPPYSQAKADFASYLALTYTRTRTRRRVTTDVYGQMVQSTLFALASNDEWFEREMKAFGKKHGKTLSEEEKKELRELALNPAGQLKIAVSKNITFETWSVIDVLTPIFIDMHWTIIKPEHGYFVTSDNP